MATAKNTSKKKKVAPEVTKEKLMECYSNFLLHEGKRPANIFLFTEQHGFSEADFYRFFASFNALEAEYMAYFFTESVAVIKKTKGYKNLSDKEKLLNLYFTFIENLTLNRSLVLVLLGTDLIERGKKLKKLHRAHRSYVQTLNLKDWKISEKLPKSLQNIKHQSKEHLLWLHLVSILKFWKEDTSTDFEKTDLYIEKTIDTGFELVENPILDKFIDLGKFLWQEKFQ